MSGMTWLRMRQSAADHVRYPSLRRPCGLVKGSRRSPDELGGVVPSCFEAAVCGAKPTLRDLAKRLSVGSSSDTRVGSSSDRWASTGVRREQARSGAPEKASVSKNGLNGEWPTSCGPLRKSRRTSELPNEVSLASRSRSSHATTQTPVAWVAHLDRAAQARSLTDLVRFIAARDDRP